MNEKLIAWKESELIIKKIEQINLQFMRLIYSIIRSKKTSVRELSHVTMYLLLHTTVYKIRIFNR